MIVDAGVEDVVVVEDSITGCVDRQRKGDEVNRFDEQGV